MDISKNIKDTVFISCITSLGLEAHLHHRSPARALHPKEQTVRNQLHCTLLQGFVLSVLNCILNARVFLIRMR